MDALIELTVPEEERIKIIEKFTEFFNMYYKNEIIKAVEEEKQSIVIDYKILEEKYDYTLAHQLLEKPEEILYYAEEALRKIVEKYVETLEQPIKVRIKNLPETNTLRIRDIRSHHLGKLIQVEGVIKLSSEVLPQIVAVKFKHEYKNKANNFYCGETFWYPQRSFLLEKPQVCPKCGNAGGKFIILEKKYVDTQRLVLEEPPDQLERGEQPRRITVFLRGDLCEPKMERRTTPGNRVIITGIVKEIPIKSKNTTLYELVIEANYIEPVEKELEEIEITKEDEIKIKELAASDNLWDILISSIAPSIYGYNEIKKAILLQLVGGVKKVRPDGTKIRGDIHILLVGDPGAGKSQILKYVASIAPKGKYVSGKGATAVGLTASLVRDEFLKGGWALEAGALVLASGGVCAIDEFDKISKEELAALHEALEQQTITITKANIHATLRAETSVLAAANPKYGRWDRMKTIAEQIDLPPTIINRFDLIFVIVDIPEEQRDLQVADHVLGSLVNLQKVEPKIPPEFLRKYIAYAKRIIPQWTEDAIKEIKEFYIKLRKTYGQEDTEVKAVPISPRQLEALIRLAEASARIRLSKFVTKEDAKLAIELLMYSLKQVGVDPETGRIDIDIVATGVSATQRSRLSIILDIIDELSKMYNGPVPIEDIIIEAERKKIPKQKAEEIVRKLIETGELFEPRPGFVQRVT